jgi:hypothetical protein
MEIQSFFPNYPDIHPDNSLYDLYNGENFNQIIFKKKEFYDLKLDAKQPDSPMDGEYYNHQKIIARFLASYTLYNELFLYWSPGTGKTSGAIGAIENIIRQRELYNIKKAIILVKNMELIKQFQNEIIYVCCKGKYKPDEDEENFRFSKSKARPFYHIQTYKKFYNIYHRNPNHLKKMYSNSIIIIDEVHDLLKSEMYDFFNQFLHIVENRKIIIMTGTPMMNKASDIALLMNLILPRELQLPTGPNGRDFDETFLNPDTGLVEEKEVDELENIFRGRVSYLKSKVNIPYEYQGIVVNRVLSYPIFTSLMSDYQSEYYKLAYRSDKVADKKVAAGFYRNSRDASLFVYPDGSYGSVGYKTFVRKRGTNFVANFLSDLRKMSVEDKLERIGKWSMKYANVIRNIINNKDQNIFVYMKEITGSGAIIFGLCLELFGYKRTNGKVSTPGTRYAILSRETETDWSTVRKSFNRASNKNGKFIQVLIGGEQVKQGVTFWSIRQIHIVTPEWNFSSIDQAVARGIRMKAHRHMEPGSVVKIYLHASILKNIESIDIKLYEIAQKKDFGIKSIEYVIKTTSMDCALTYERNINRDGQNMTRGCEYNDCIYRCKGVTYPYVIPENELDKSTYQLYYEEYYQQKLIQLLQTIFRKQNFITLWELVDFFDNTYTSFQIFQALSYIIKRSIIFLNKYGFPSYLHEDSNIFFITNNITSSNNFLLSYYNENPPIREYTNFMKVVDDVISSAHSINNDIIDILTLDFEQQIKKIKILHPIAQSKFIENAILGPSSELSKWVLQYYSESIIVKPDGTYHTFLPNQIRKYTPETGWVDIVVQPTELVSYAHFTELLESGSDFIFGKYKGRKKLFSIVDIRDLVNSDLFTRENEIKKRGQSCTSYKLEELIDIINILNITPENNPLTIQEAIKILQKYKKLNERLSDTEKRNLAYWLSKKKNALCKTIEKWFQQHNLIVPHN